MADLKTWQREVGKVQLREGERAFVAPDGKVIATNTKDKEYQVYSKKRYEERVEKRRAKVNERLEKQKKRLEKKQTNEKKGIEEKVRKQRERLLKKQAKLAAKKQEDEKKLMQIEAQLQSPV